MSDRATEHRNRLRQHTLLRHPSARQEAIAHHYSTLAATACELAALIRERAHGLRSPEMDRLIEDSIELLRQAHVEHFGVEPSWAAPVVDAPHPEDTFHDRFPNPHRVQF